MCVARQRKRQRQGLSAERGGSVRHRESLLEAERSVEVPLAERAAAVRGAIGAHARRLAGGAGARGASGRLPGDLGRADAQAHPAGAHEHAGALEANAQSLGAVDRLRRMPSGADPVGVI